MTKAEIGSMGCKLLSIYTFANSLGALQFPVAMLQPGMPAKAGLLYRIMSFVPAIMLVMFSAILWLSARRPDSDSESIQEASVGSSAITPQVLQSVGFSVAGIMILANTVPYLGQIIFQSLGANPMQNRMFWIQVSEFLVRLALGTWLLLGTRPLQLLGVRLVRRLEKAIHKDW